MISKYQFDFDAIIYMYSTQKIVFPPYINTGHPVFFYINWLFFHALKYLGINIVLYSKLFAYISSSLLILFTLLFIDEYRKYYNITKPKVSLLISGLFLLSIPYFLYHFTLYQTNILSISFVLVALILYFRHLRDKKSNFAKYLFPVFLSLAIGTHLNTIFIFLPIAVHYLYINLRNISKGYSSPKELLFNILLIITMFLFSTFLIYLIPFIYLNYNFQKLYSFAFSSSNNIFFKINFLNNLKYFIIIMFFMGFTFPLGLYGVIKHNKNIFAYAFLGLALMVIFIFSTTLISSTCRQLLLISIIFSVFILANSFISEKTLLFLAFVSFLTFIPFKVMFINKDIVVKEMNNLIETKITSKKATICTDEVTLYPYLLVYQDNIHNILLCSDKKNFYKAKRVGCFLSNEKVFTENSFFLSGKTKPYNLLRRASLSYKLDNLFSKLGLKANSWVSDLFLYKGAVAK